MASKFLDDVSSSSDESSSPENDVIPEVDLKEREIDREEAEQALVNALKLAERNLNRFKAQAKREKELDEAHKQLLKKKQALDKQSRTVRKPVLAPTPHDIMKGPPIVKGAKTVKVDKEPDELFAISATNVATLVMDTMRDMGVVDGPVIDGSEADDYKAPIALALTHEDELEYVCYPEQLRHEGFRAVDASFPDLEDVSDKENESPADNTPVLNRILAALMSLNGKVEHLIRVQQLHTVSHVAQIRAHNLLRQLCVADGVQKAAVYKKLQLAMKSCLLASDPEFADLPFRDLQILGAFFKSQARVTKLAHFLLAYVEYDKNFNFNLLSTVLSINLLQVSFWKSGTGGNGVLPPGALYLPRYFELFMQQVGRAAHRYVHLNDDVPFNLGRFNKDMREQLYNTRRNEKKRLAVNAPVSGEPEKNPLQTQPSASAQETIDISDAEGGDGEVGDMKVQGGGDTAPLRKEASYVEKKDKKMRRKHPLASTDDDEAGDKDPTVSTAYEAAGGSSASKRSHSPAGNVPSPKRPNVTKVFDHILDMGKANKSIDDVICMLIDYSSTHGHRKGYKIACKNIRRLATDLQQLDADDEWIETVMQYKDYLKRLPMGPGAFKD